MDKERRKARTPFGNSISMTKHVFMEERKETMKEGLKE